MFGRELAKNVNKVFGKGEYKEEYVCDTHLTESQLHFSLRKRSGKSVDAFLVRLCKSPNRFLTLLDILAKEVVPDYIENSILFKLNNNVLEGSLQLRDGVTSDFMFLYDELIVDT